MFNFLRKQKKEPQNIDELLIQFKALKGNFDKITRELKDLKMASRFSFQKIGMVRFNPFDNMGGDHSFSVALLDMNNSGVIITSLYIRDGNRVYGKAIHNGASEYSLSAEEKEALAKAINNK